MRNPPVNWAEGMFLRPQHFQASDRYWSEALTTALQWDQHYHYGVRTIQISKEALANHQVQVTGLQARMRDGLLLNLDGAQLNRLDLKPAFAKASSVIVYLAVPKMILGRPNVGQTSQNADFRFVPVTLSMQEECQGGNDQPIEFRAANVRLVTSTEELGGLEILPIGRVQRAGVADAVPELDGDYFPPMLAVDAWPPLRLGIIREIYDIIGRRIEVLSEQLTKRGAKLATSQVGDLDNILLLHTLNEAHAYLHCLTFAQGVHPFLAYRELCRVVGMLSIFDPARRTQGIPEYDHDDLARIFKWIRSRILQLLDQGPEAEFEQRYFEGAGPGMQVAIESRWLNAGWDWYVGVNGQNISESECRKLLQPGKLNWKMGSANKVDMIFRLRLPGVEPQELPDPPYPLPALRGWTYYEVRREGAAWNDVLATQTLAIRFTNELIGNLDTLAGKQTVEVKLPDDRALLRFALFAVPRAKS